MVDLPKRELKNSNLKKGIVCFKHWDVATIKIPGNCLCLGSCGSGVEPASCYQRVEGSIPWSACQSVRGQDTDPHVLVGTLHGSRRHQRIYVLLYVALDKSF